MELTKIKKLLNNYFEGITTLKEEAKLKKYFTGANVDASLESYVPIFQSFVAAKSEVSDKEVSLSVKKRKKRIWQYPIAAVLVLAIAIAGFLYNNELKKQAEKEKALAAYEETKKALKFLSHNFNEGAEDLILINQFNKTKEKIIK